MPRRTKEAAVEVDVEALVAEVAALKKEVAALKSAVAKRPAGGGSDPRVDKIIEVLKRGLGNKKLVDKYDL